MHAFVCTACAYLYNTLHTAALTEVKGGRDLCSTDDVTQVELFLERGLKKTVFFFPHLEVIIVQSLSAMHPLLAVCLISLFWSICSLS